MTANEALALLLVLAAILGIIAIFLGIAWDRASTRATDAAEQRDEALAQLAQCEQRLDAAYDRIGVLRQAARNERMNGRRLSQELNQTRHDMDAHGGHLPTPTTPMPSDVVALFAEVDAIVRGAEGGEVR